MRPTVPLLESMTSIRPGPWCEKPLWSLRQAVDVRRMFKDATRSRQGRLIASWSHLVCWTVMGAVVVVGYRRADKAAILDLEDGAEPVRVDLVRAEEPEVSLPGVPGEG